MSQNEKIVAVPSATEKRQFRDWEEYINCTSTVTFPSGKTWNLAKSFLRARNAAKRLQIGEEQKTVKVHVSKLETFENEDENPERHVENIDEKKVVELKTLLTINIASGKGTVK